MYSDELKEMEGVREMYKCYVNILQKGSKYSTLY